jgi:centrin-3
MSGDGSLFQRSIDGMGFGLRAKNKSREPTMPLTDDERKEIEEAFTLFDADKTGSVDYHELKVAMRALGFAVKKADVLRLVRDVDIDETGRIDREQFISILTRQYSQRNPEEEIKKAFKLFDADNTGKISLKNMRLISKELGEDIRDDELQAMIDEFDKDTDGQISESEFISIMKQTTMY